MTESAQTPRAFEAFADPTRREILLALADGEMAATEIAKKVQTVGRTAVSSHLRVLRLAGLVSERRAGRHRYYSINPSPASHILDFISSVYSSSLFDLDPGRAGDSDAGGEVEAG